VNASLRRRAARAWMLFAVTALVFGLLCVGLTRQQTEQQELSANQAAQRELRQLELALQGLLEHAQYRAAQDLVGAWGEANAHAADIHVVARSGEMIAAFHRTVPPAGAALHLRSVLDYSYDSHAMLELVVDQSATHAEEATFGMRVLALYVAALLMGAYLVGLNLRRQRDAEQLRLATEQLDSYFHHALDLFGILDAQGRLRRLNARWTSVLGYPLEALKDCSILELVAPGEIEETRRFLATLARQQVVTAFTNHLRHSDGTHRTIEWSAQPAGDSFYVAARDVTEREIREQEIRFLSRIYSTLSETNQLIARCPDEATLFENICRIAVEFGGMKLAWVGKEDASTQRIVPVSCYGEARAYLDGINVSARGDLPEGHGPTGRAFREGAANFVNDHARDPSLQPWRERSRPFAWGSSGAIPIRRDGRPYATLTFYDTSAHAFTAKVVALLTEMGADIEYALLRFDLEAHKHRAEEESRIAAIAFESQEAMLVADAEGKILRVNAAFTQVTGYSQEEVLGRNPSVLQSGRHPESFFTDLWEQVKARGHWQGEVWDRRKNGEVYPKWLSISCVRDRDGAPSHYVETFADTSERKAAAAAISRLAYYDALTALPNRQLMMDRLKQAIRAGARSGRFGAILFLDLDNFKNINDTLGHDEGDRLLTETARRLRSGVREQDTVSRFGGDEFVVLLENLEGTRDKAGVQAKLICEKLLAGLAEPYRLRDKEYLCSASIGVALWRGGPLIDEHELLKRSDLAMYEAKRAGRNTVRFFDPAMQTSLENRARLETRLRAGLVLGQFRLHYQPQVDVDGRVLGAESLLRWLDPERGMTTPGEFIALAEESELIVAIGHWVLEAACAQLRAWSQQPELQALHLAVNISPRQFAADAFVADVAAILARTGADPRLLQFEITEGMLLTNVEETIAKMAQLRQLGVSFALDDFGTGYSSLSYLHRLPLNVLKIDQSFVHQMGANRQSEAIVRTIIQMGQSLGLSVLAEGVETAAQREQLVRQGCARFQGYWFGRPLAVEGFEQRLAATRVSA